MSQEFTDEELDAFEAEMKAGNDVQDDTEVPGDNNDVQEQEQPSDAVEEQPLADEQQKDETETPSNDKSDETNPEAEVDFLAKYLKENPLEAKSKSARFLIDDPKKLQESINKALDYHKKTSELAKWREDIEVISQGGLTKDDLILLAEAKKGNKEALAALAGTTNIDLYDISEDDANNFQPTQHYPTATEIEVNQVAEEISSDPEVANTFAEFIPDMPNDFKELLNSNPQALRGFADDIRSGIAQKIYGEALASQAMYGGDFLSHYQATGQRLFAQQQPSVQQQAPVQQEQPSVPARPQISDRERNLREKATATTKRQQSGGKSFLADAKSIWDMSDEEFDNLSSADIAKLR